MSAVKKSNNGEFIAKSKLKHGDRYDYSLVDYKNWHTKVLIICNEIGHGVFPQEPNSHLCGANCPKCTGSYRPSNGEYIKMAQDVHDNEYDYSKTEYKTANEKVIIICKKPGHGEFEQKAAHHLNGCGCPKCNGGGRSNTEEFKEKASIIHEGKYDYSKVNYTKNSEHVIIICTEPGHGEFKQTPANHLRENGCPKCSGVYHPTTEEYIEMSKLTHGEDKYDYSKVEYKTSLGKIKIICPKPNHGEFEQMAFSHLNGANCPKCNQSKGEIEVAKHLLLNGLIWDVDYFTEKTFSDCINELGNKLRFDFYLPYYNLCIEYDGRQHFESVDYFGGDKEFEKLLVRDKIKDVYCESRGMKMLRIKYTEFDEIESIILNIFKGDKQISKAA